MKNNLIFILINKIPMTFIYILVSTFFVLIFFFSRYDYNLFSEGIIGDGNDNLLNLTILENNINNFNGLLQGKPLKSIYESHAHFPYEHTTLFTETLYVQSIIYFIFNIFLDNEVLSFNLLFLIAFIVNFLSSLFLCKVYKINEFYSILLSILYTSSHLISIQFVHLQNQFIFGFPLVAAYIILSIEKFKYRYLFYIIVSINLQFFSCAYYGLYVLYFCLLFSLLLLLQKNKTLFDKSKLSILLLFKEKNIFTYVITAFFATIPIAILYIPFKFLTNNFKTTRLLFENEYFSNRLWSLIAIPINVVNYPFGFTISGEAHNSFFLGFLLYFIILIIIILGIKRFKISYTYLIISILFFLLSLGPSIMIFDMEFSAPYRILYNLFPGFSNLRVPNRISVLSLFFVFIFIIVFISQNKESKIFKNKSIYILLFLLSYVEYGYLTNITEYSRIPRAEINIFRNDKKLINKANNKNVVLFLDYKSSNLVYKTGPLPEYIALKNNYKTFNGYSGYNLPLQNFIETSLQDEKVYKELFIFLNKLGLTHILIFDYDKSIQIMLNKYDIFEVTEYDMDNQFIVLKFSKNFVNIISQNYTYNKKIKFEVLNSNTPSKNRFLIDSDYTTYWEGEKYGYQSEHDFIDIRLLNKFNSFFIELSNGPYVNRFPYGLEILCGDRKVSEYSFPSFYIADFLNNPYGNQKLMIEVSNCKSNNFQMKVNKQTKYSIWTVAEMQIFH